MSKNKGFTLIEVLLSICIMALIAQGTTLLMQQVFSSNETVTEKSTRLNELQKAFSVMEKDFTQMVPRETRMTGSNIRSTMVVGENQFNSEGTGLSFVRGGALNPGALLPRGEVIRVWYRLKEGKLERAIYAYPDTIIGYEPKFEPLLTDVKSFKVLFYRYGTWSPGWVNRTKIPLGVRVELELKDYGKLMRMYYIPAGSR